MTNEEQKELYKKAIGLDPKGATVENAKKMLLKINESSKY